MVDDFSAHKSAEEAHERAHHSEGPRWIPIAASILAVLAALANLLSNQRSTEALVAKNNAILATAQASDQYNFYQAHRLRETVYQAAIDAHPGVVSATLRSVASRERGREPAILAHAKAFERRAIAEDTRSDVALGSHETLEIAVTLFDVAIVLVSISALVGSRLLPIVASIASVVGAIFFLRGLV